ncbi:MAG TPA: aminotransferase class IV [Gemmatimonadales bacterium]|nr:aminotransferase class IV [Gemmatimonadales bacterium]
MAAPAPVLIETVRVRDGVAPLWYLHLRRLASSCKALGVPLPGELITPAGGRDRVHRLEVSPRGVEISERPVGTTAPVSLIQATVVHRPYPHKTTERRQFDHALAEARTAGADDAVLLTQGGYVAECALWGLFWWEGGRLCAPSLELGVLPGVARARLEELTGGIAARRVKPGDLEGRSPFVANAARGVVPVANLAGRPVPQDPGTPRLSDMFWP